MKNVSVSEAQTLKKPIFCNVRLEKNAHIYRVYLLTRNKVISKTKKDIKNVDRTKHS